MILGILYIDCWCLKTFKFQINLYVSNILGNNDYNYYKNLNFMQY